MGDRGERDPTPLVNRENLEKAKIGLWIFKITWVATYGHFTSIKRYSILFYIRETYAKMPSNSANIKKLIMALNLHGMKIMYTTSQFWSEEEDRAITVYHVKQAVWDEDRGKYTSVDLYKAPSQIQIVLYLRDLWYTINGKEVPQNNELWNKIKSNSQKGE